MTRRLSGFEVAERIRTRFPDAVLEETADWVVVEPRNLAEIMRFVRDDEELDAKFLNMLCGVDRIEDFEMVYHLSSLTKNHTFALKVRADHDNPSVPSVVPVWLGAHLQERETYDLMGIRFEGHPSLKRLFLWEGFPGHPLRKDFLRLPGGQKPGLARFPKEMPGRTGDEFRPELGGPARDLPGDEPYMKD
jgi:NADH-quinone oxidoreductase subunit C